MVYVDDSRVSSNRSNYVTCRMGADTEEELHRAASSLHISQEYAIEDGRGILYYRISWGKRGQMVKRGAVELRAVDFNDKLRRFG